MEFTFRGYEKLLKSLKDNNYKIIGYKEADEFLDDKVCILRHDIDMSVKKAVKLSELEKKNSCSSTYFVLLCTSFYNVFDGETKKELEKILSNGSSIGLHFDEVKYPELNALEGINYENALVEKVRTECDILSNALGVKIDMVSMHRPSKKILTENIDFKDILNSYSEKYFTEFKYLSDSRRNWRENVFAHIENGVKRLHILTHPIWYQEGKEISMVETLQDFCDEAKVERFESLKSNIRDLQMELK